MTVYVTASEIIHWNEHYAGPGGLRDFGLLDSALQRPQTWVGGAEAYPSLEEKAAALLHSLSRNGPFMDADKRTAWTATNVFCLLNGLLLTPPDQGDVIALDLDTAQGFMDVPESAGVLKWWDG